VTWDKYAPFYDWENARTMGRRDLPFWKRFVSRSNLPVLELGCGTGRVLLPLARDGAAMVGVDRSAAMLARAARRIARARSIRQPHLVLGDICALPFPAGSFSQVIAPYGVLQSLISDEDFAAALAESARVLAPHGRLGIDLVPDLKDWKAYQRQVRFRGRLGQAQVTLVESVTQNRRRGTTTFLEEFTTRRGAVVRRHRFTLAFRTRPMDVMATALAAAGFRVEDVCGNYRGGVWTPDAGVWVITARKRPSSIKPRNASAS